MIGDRLFFDHLGSRRFPVAVLSREDDVLPLDGVTQHELVRLGGESQGNGNADGGRAPHFWSHREPRDPSLARAWVGKRDR